MGLSPVPFACGKSDFPPPFSSLDAPPVDARKAPPLVLVIDDEKIIADTLAHVLHLSGFRADAAYSGRAALEQVAQRCPDVVITDVVMPEINGIETAKQLLATCPATRVILLSGQAATAEMIKQACAEGYQFELLAKPLHPEDLLAVLHRLGF